MKERKLVTELPKGAADRLAYLLKLVAAAPARFSLTEIAASAQMPQSSVHRLLQSLVRAGLVERSAGQTYRAGRELHRLASQLVGRFDLTRSARPFLDDLVENWQETAVLCVYSPVQHRAVIADVAQTPHALRFAVERGMEIELPWGSLGLAILAFLTPGEIERVIREAKTGPLTGRPRQPRAALDADLAQIRANGYSRYYDPLIEIAGIAGPVFGADGEVLGCIGVTMPSKRYQLHLEDNLVLAVREAARKLSELAEIGHS